MFHLWANKFSRQNEIFLFTNFIYIYICICIYSQIYIYTTYPYICMYIYIPFSGILVVAWGQLTRVDYANSFPVSHNDAYQDCPCSYFLTENARDNFLGQHWGYHLLFLFLFSGNLTVVDDRVERNPWK